MNEPSKKSQLYELIRAKPFISQQDVADQLGLSRSAVAGHIASLIRERRLLGRAYVLPDSRPVMCIGAANLDRKLRTLATLQMGTSNPASAEEVHGGVARNIAENLARLGTPVALLTALGEDAAGQSLQAHAEQAGIDTRGSLRVHGAASGTYTAVLDERGEMVLALADMQLYQSLAPAFLASRQLQRAGAALTVADLNLARESVETLLADAARGAVPLVLVAMSQPKMAHLPDDLRGAHLLILNRAELETRSGRCLPGDAALAEACGTLHQQGALNVIVTCGGDGVYYSAGDGALRHLPAPEVDIVDVTGAGDAVAAAVCWSLCHGSADLELACRRGLALAAVTLASAATVAPQLSPALLLGIDGADSTPPTYQLFQD